MTWDTITEVSIITSRSKVVVTPIATCDVAFSFIIIYIIVLPSYRIQPPIYVYSDQEFLRGGDCNSPSMEELKNEVQKSKQKRQWFYASF